MVYSVLFGSGALLFGRGLAITLSWALLALASAFALTRLLSARR